LAVSKIGIENVLARQKSWKKLEKVGESLVLLPQRSHRHTCGHPSDVGSSYDWQTEWEWPAQKDGKSWLSLKLG
jgi:hypothetical protein